MRRQPALLLFALALGLTSCANDSAAPDARGKGPVTRADLLGRHHVRATGGSDATFRWDFTDTGFSIAKDGTKPIPADVRAAVAHTDADVTRIDGRWTLTDGGLALTDLQVVRTDGVRDHIAPDVTLSPFRTPVVRFELGDVQYVLDPR